MAFAYLSDAPEWESQDGDNLEMLDLRYPGVRGEKLRVLWGAVGGEILAKWTQERPGTRPRAWWRVDAPRWDDPYELCYFHGSLPEPRRRLGGKGTPIFECLGYVPLFEFGIPAGFITASTLAVYDKTGGLENRAHPGSPVEAFDPKNPPRYESQARYLWDRDLLEPEEKKVIERLGLLDEAEVVTQQDELST